MPYFPPKQASETALSILTKLLTVDGSGSGLDADTLDGLHAAEITGITDHGLLTGLSDNDHPQYYLASNVSSYAATLLLAADEATARSTLGLTSMAVATEANYLLVDGTRNSTGIQQFTAGIKTGIVQVITNSATAFQVRDATGTAVVTVDTTNKRVGIGITGSDSILHVAGSLSGSGYKFGNQVSSSISSTDSAVYGWYQNPTLIPANSTYGNSVFALQGYITATSGYTVNQVSQIDVGTLIKTGAGTLANVYGIYVRNQNIGTNNYGIYQVGTTNLNYFGGKVGIGQTAPTSLLDIASSTVSNASLRIRSGVAPTSPNDGDIWFDGTHLYCRIAGVTKQLDN